MEMKLNKKIALSIIIPVYNLDKYISECINSIIKQIREEYSIEILIIDDGSTDKSASICKEFCKKYDFINYHYQVNSGVSKARNYGLDIARGKYIYFVDGDDLLYENALKNIFSKIYYDFDIVISRFEKMYEGKLLKNKNAMQYEYINDLSYPNNIENIFEKSAYTLSLGCNVIKKSLFFNNNIKINEDLKYTEDMDCLLRILLKCKKICILQDPIYIYRQSRTGSATNMVSTKRIKDLMYFIDTWLEISNTVESIIIAKYLKSMCAYQYSITIGLYYQLKKEDKIQLKNEIYKRKKILKYAINKKEKLVNIFVNIFGLNHTSFILFLWIKLKNIIRI